jgi:hypothetical protein
LRRFHIVSHVTDALMWFCQWCDDSFFGAGVRNSVWLFPFTEIFHLVALGILGGTVLIVNMRLLGAHLPGASVSEIANDVRPWMYGSLAVMLISGFFLFSSESVKMYGNPAFRIKMLALVLAITFSLTVHKRLVSRNDRDLTGFGPKAVAIVSLALWAAVGLAGRAIGYVGK